MHGELELGRRGDYEQLASPWNCMETTKGNMEGVFICLFQVGATSTDRKHLISLVEIVPTRKGYLYCDIISKDLQIYKSYYISIYAQAPISLNHGV